MQLPPATHVYTDEPGCIVCGDPTGVRCCEFGADTSIAVEQPSDRERAAHRETREQAEAAEQASLIDCPRCDGSGEIRFNRTWRHRDDHAYDESALCNVCNGDGLVRPDDYDNDHESPGAVSPARGVTHEE